MIHAAPPERGFIDLHLPYVKYDKVFSDIKLQVRRDRSNVGIASAPAVVGSPGWSTVLRKPASAISTMTSGIVIGDKILGNDKSGDKGQRTAGAAAEVGAEVIALNRYAQRVDVPPPALKSGILEKWRARGMKPCNNFIFGPGCSKLDCLFSHEKMTDTEKQAQRMLVRNSRCRKMHDCRNVFCYYGHQCPRQPNCSLVDCEFKQQHGKDTTVLRFLPGQ